MQGARPNYQSSISPLTYKKKSYAGAKHEKYLGYAQAELSEITEREQPTLLAKVTSNLSTS